MTSEIRTNSLTSRAGLSTVTLTDSGPMFSGITTFVDNSTFSVGTGGTIHAPATNTLNIGVNNTESIRIDSNSNLKVAGIVTATHFHGDGSNLTGISGGISTDAYGNTFGGHLAGNALTSGNDDNVIIGREAGEALNSGDDNVFIGAHAGEAATSLSQSVLIGYKAGSTGQTGSRNVIIGDGNFNSNNQDQLLNCTFVGYGAGSNQQDSYNEYNTFIGYGAGGSSGSDYDVCIGRDAGSRRSDRFGIFIGDQVGNINGTYGDMTGQNNIMIGRQTGNASTSGADNTLMGHQCGMTLTTGSNNLVLGHDADVSGATVSNEITLGDANITKFRIPGLNYVNDAGKVGINQTSPQRILHVGTSGTAEANIRIQGGSDYGEIRVKDSDNELSFHHNVGGAGSRELFSSNGSTGHFSINTYSYQALTITTNENGTNGPEVQLMHNSASPAANDTIGQIRYSGKDSAGDTTLYSKIETKVLNATNGSESGHLDFSTRGGGAYNSIFRLNARSTASAPNYTTDDMNGIILDTYNTGNPYPRYMNFIAKSAGNTASNIGFWTEAVGGSPIEKLRITSDGKIGINATTTALIAPTYTLDLGGNDGVLDTSEQNTLRIRCNNGGTAIRVGAGGGASSVVLMRVDGNSGGYQCLGESDSSNYGASITYRGDRSGNENSLGIYMDNSTSASQVEALNLRQNGDYIFGGSSYSDRDQKENITPISGTALDKITQLSPKTWNWKPEYHDIPTDRIFGGFIAQEVQPHIPSIVTGTDGQGDMALDYQGLLAWTIKAVTELNSKVETLEQENIALRARVTNLEGN